MRLLDRWRVEGAVWVVDTWIGDLLRRRRRAVREELRTNLLASAEEVGAREAVRRLGSLQRLAAGYLDAEFGDVSPRPNWVRGLTWTIAIQMVLLAALFAGMHGYTAALDATQASGTYDWSPLGPLGPQYTETRSVGQLDGFVIEFHLGGVLAITGVLLLVFVVAGRTWRVIPALRGRRTIG